MHVSSSAYASHPAGTVITKLAYPRCLSSVVDAVQDLLNLHVHHELVALLFRGSPLALPGIELACRFSQSFASGTSNNATCSDGRCKEFNKAHVPPRSTDFTCQS
jgi:hypothetical protein